MRRPVVVTLVVVAVFGGLVFALTRPPSRAAFDAAVAAERAAGRPVTFEELVGSVPADDANGHADLVAADRWMTDRHGSQASWSVTGPWNASSTETWFDTDPPERLAELDRFLVESQPFFDLVAKAVGKPRIVAAVRRDPNGMPSEDDVPLAPRVAKVLAARALADPDPADRLEAMRLAAALAARREASSLIDVMVDAAVLHGALNALRRDVERGSVDPSAARAALAPHLGHPWPADLAAGAGFERVLLIELGERVASGADFDAFVGWPGPPRSGLERMQDRIERLFQGRRVATPDDLARALEAIGRIAELPAGSYLALADGLSSTTAPLLEDDFVKQFAIAYPLLCPRLGERQAQQRLALTALAALEHRATRGALPASIGDLARAFPDGVPLDPFTDAPFEFALGEKTLRIASTGRLAAEPARSEQELRERGLVWELKR